MILFILAILIVVIILCRRYTVKTSGKLDKDGLSVFTCFDERDIQILRTHFDNDEQDLMRYYIINHPKVGEEIRKHLGGDYQFSDYIMSIKKSQIHTCHKDNNSHIFNNKQKHPSYTIIFYLYQMQSCLDVISKSHTVKNEIYHTDVTEHVKCSPGDAILFDATLTHCGSINYENENNPRIQMKLYHIDDIDNEQKPYRKILDKENNLPFWVKNIQKHFTCQFPILSDVGYDRNKHENSYKTFNRIFYGSSDFYI